MLVPASLFQEFFDWFTVEKSELIVNAIVPITVASLGILIFRLTSSLENQRWRNQKVIERRLTVFEQMAPEINDLYCYFLLVGNWKRLSPVSMIEAKRKLDRMYYTNAFLFSETFKGDYKAFMGACFLTFTGPNADARLRTTIEVDDQSRRIWFGEQWQTDWEQRHFAETEATPRGEVADAYRSLMHSFSLELDLIHD